MQIQVQIETIHSFGFVSLKLCATQTTRNKKTFNEKQWMEKKREKENLFDCANMNEVTEFSQPSLKFNIIKSNWNFYSFSLNLC